MKECTLSLVGMKCSDFSPEGCILMNNEGFNNGAIDTLKGYLEKESDESLLTYLEAHSPNGRLEKRCLASPTIVSLINEVLNSRIT